MSHLHTRTMAVLEQEDAERMAWLNREMAKDKAGSKRTLQCIDCGRSLENNATTGRCEPCQTAERKRQKKEHQAKYRQTDRAKELERAHKKRQNEKQKAKRRAEAEAAQDKHRLAIIEALQARRIETATRKLRERGYTL